ncbi:extensin-like, partial [Tachysurus ichikawai]
MLPPISPASSEPPANSAQKDGHTGDSQFNSNLHFLQITNQDPNDGGRDVMINELLGGAAMYQPENVFPPEN